MRWWPRRRPRPPYVGDCPECGHDWRGHRGGAHYDSEAGGCDECGYEVEHGERPRDAGLCQAPFPEEVA